MKEMYIVDGGFPGAMSELDDPFVNLRCMQSVICKKTQNAIYVLCFENAVLRLFQAGLCHVP